MDRARLCPITVPYKNSYEGRFQSLKAAAYPFMRKLFVRSPLVALNVLVRSRRCLLPLGANGGVNPPPYAQSRA